MDEKKVDNRIIPKKENINKVDNMIDQQKSKLKKIELFRDNYYELYKNTEKCIDLLFESIGGTKSKSIINDMKDSNILTYKKVSQNINDELKIIKVEINKLYCEKEQMISNKKKKDK